MDGASSRAASPLLTAAVGLVGLFATSGEAQAACDPAAASNVVATCTGTTTNQGTGAPGTSAGTSGYGNGAEANIAIGVVSGATVTGANDGIAFSTGAVTNAGAITGLAAAGNGIRANNAINFTNSGAITGGTSPGGFNAGIFSFGPASGTNSGSISGTLGLIGGGGVTLTNSGSLTGTADTALFAIGPLNLTNSGSITGGDGVQAVNGMTVTNSGSIAGTFTSAFTSGVGLRHFSDTGTVVNTGTITGINGGIASSTTLNVTNVGSIASTATGSAITASTLSVVNSGKVSGQSSALNALTVTAQNSGTIEAIGPGLAIGIAGQSVALTNSGTVTGSVGIFATNIAAITNSGAITGATFGINHGGTATVVNSGTISGGQVGIGAAAANNVLNLVNTGTVTGGITGIRANASGNITNAGTIIGSGGTAILFGANGVAADSLTVLPGARFGGLVDFGGGADKVAFGTGSWIINTANFNAALSTITTPGNPYFVTPNQIVVADVSTFGVQNRAIMDITGWIASVLPETPVFASASSGVANAFAATDAALSPFAAFDSYASSDALGYAKAPVFKAASVAYTDGSAIWAKGFGGERQQGTSGAFSGGTTTGYGGALGYERLINPDLRIGGMIGGSANRTNLNQNAGSTNTDTVFGGIYGRNSWGATFLDLAVIGGNLDNRNQRNIAGGLAAQTASASYGGWFVMPSMALGRRLDIDGRGFTITPALKVRYVDANFDGFTETGSTANLTVGSRSFQAFEERGELTFANTGVFGANRLTGRLTVGALAQQRSGGGQVNIALLGQNFLAATPDRANVTGGFGGAGVDWQVGKVTLFAAGEAMAGSDSTRTYSGRGGARVSW